MQNKYFQKLISVLLVTSFVVVPFHSTPKKTEAQSLAGYTSGLVPAIAQLPLCRGKLTGATKYLFGQSSAVDALIARGASEKEIAEALALEGQVQEAQSQLDKIGVYDAEANKKINELKKQLDAIEASTGSLDTNDTCLKNIGRLVIKMLLQKLTLSTVNWINSGFDGKPAFIQDPGKFFGDIAKTEILQFGLEINNPELFPFGKEWMRAQATQFNNKFQDNARYSLDEMIRSTTPQYSAVAFQQDFSSGGWGAWSAMTQVPANNPLGFQIMASNELQRRLEGTSQSTAQNVREALDAANGFLGDERCVEPEGLTKQQHREGLERRSAGEEDAPICLRTEYVTPGKLIAEAATSTIQYPENNLLKADDLNDAVAAILDALLARFSADIMEKGYANFDSTGIDGSFVYNQEALSEGYASQAEQDFSPVHLTNSWLSANPNFNIRTDLTQALIDEQRTYADKLRLQNIELNSTTDGNVYKMGADGRSNAYGLIPAIAQLDYCIPGPHPGWERDSKTVLDAVTGVIVPETVDSVKDKDEAAVLGTVQAVVPMAGAAAGAAIGASLGSVVPIVGTLIGGVVGALFGSVLGWLTKDDDAQTVRRYYSGIIHAFSGVGVNHTVGDSGTANNLMSKQGAVQVMNNMLSRYVDMVHAIYNPKLLPAVHRESATEFGKLKGYSQIIENNERAISATKNVENTLGEIKRDVEELNAEFRPTGEFSSIESEEAYERELKPLINAFGRLSADMVNGEDIASADNLLNQIIDEKNYVYNDLLKGPFGCEKDLELANQNLPDHLYETTRMKYPFPILYSYDLPAGATIPDPLDSGFVNRTNEKATGKYGPGFLSAFYFQTNRHDDSFETCRLDEEDVLVPLSCQLETIDLLPISEHVEYRGFVGRRIGAIPNNSGCQGQYDDDPKVYLKTPPSCSTGPWEHSIGVY